MFKDVVLVYILLPVFIVWCVVVWIVRFRSRNENPIRRAFQRFTVSTIVTGATLILLWLCLPHTAVLGTFGYPDNINQIQTQLVLQYLQDYNKALVRTTEVLHWFIFIFVWWFLTSLFEFSRAVTNSPAEQDSRKESIKVMAPSPLGTPSV